jgi:hypothetical protein
MENFEKQFPDVDDIPTKAIELIDDALAGLSEEEQYGERGDILRYILQRLQQ